MNHDLSFKLVLLFTLCLDKNFEKNRKKGKGMRRNGSNSCLFRNEGKGREIRLEFSL